MQCFKVLLPLFFKMAKETCRKYLDLVQLRDNFTKMMYFQARHHVASSEIPSTPK